MWRRVFRRRRPRRFPGYFPLVYWFSAAGFFGLIAVEERSAWRWLFALGLIVTIWLFCWWYGAIPLFPTRRGQASRP